MREPRDPEGFGAVLHRTPGANPVLMQLEDPGHLVLARELAVVVPVPASHDQSDGAAATALGVALVKLLELDRLLDPARLARRPLAPRLRPLQKPLHRVQ